MCCVRQSVSYSSVPWSIRPSLWVMKNMEWMIQNNTAAEKCTRATTSINRLLMAYCWLVGQCSHRLSYDIFLSPLTEMFPFQLCLMWGKQFPAHMTGFQFNQLMERELLIPLQHRHPTPTYSCLQPPPLSCNNTFTKAEHVPNVIMV